MTSLNLLLEHKDGGAIVRGKRRKRLKFVGYRAYPPHDEGPSKCLRCGSKLEPCGLFKKCNACGLLVAPPRQLAGREEPRRPRAERFEFTGKHAPHIILYDIEEKENGMED